MNLDEQRCTYIYLIGMEIKAEWNNIYKMTYGSGEGGILSYHYQHPQMARVAQIFDALIEGEGRRRRYIWNGNFYDQLFA